MNFKSFKLFMICFIFSDAALCSTPIGTFGAWEAYTEKEKHGIVCFIGSSPIKMEGKYKKRGESFVLVTHRPKVSENNVVMVAAGYLYKKNSKVTVLIGNNVTELFTNNGFAFATTGKIDNALVKAMKKGSKMIVKGYSKRGTLTTDTYSLKGFTSAYKKIGQACKL